MKTLTVVEIVKQLLSAKQSYYIGKPQMTDAAFDALEDQLRSIAPNDPYFKVVGNEIKGNSKTKVKHEIPMLSCGKAKSPQEVTAWLEKIGYDTEELMAQPKIDGLSCAAVYDKGKLMMVKTRGNGSVGQNITHIAAFVNIPKTINIKNEIEVRGELYIPKNTKYPNPENKPLRNIAVGLVNRKDSGLEDLKYVHFVAYQVYGSPEKKETSKMFWLDDNKFEVVDWRGINEIDLKSFYAEYLKTLRNKWLYETDGIVITINKNDLWQSINDKYTVDHHNHYNIALKPPSEGMETVLEDIIWQVSRQGKLIPVAVVKTVNVSGRKVSRASLTSYENVIRMKLEKGDKVFIEVANDVIPYLAENISKGVKQR